MGEDRDAAFHAYVSARSPALLRTAYLLTGDHHLGEDLLQTVLAKTYVAWPRIRDKGALDAYVRQGLVTTYTSWWRRRWRGERPTGELPEQPHRPTEPDPGDRADMWALLAELPPRQRAVMVLRYYEDLSEAEIARVMGCSAGTVKSQASKAMGSLRTRLGQGSPGDPTRRQPPHSDVPDVHDAGSTPGGAR
jgi:RNA polymerase sigma-70 factor (sigma-E family)